jgi:hypothetical protein
MRTIIRVIRAEDSWVVIEQDDHLPVLIRMRRYEFLHQALRDVARSLSLVGFLEGNTNAEVRPVTKVAPTSAPVQSEK